jgi:hypothetical protein
MWSYYGSKANVIDLYPKPKHPKIIEPFAGTARYALRFFDREVLLVDKYEVIVRIWKWLQQCSPTDILSLPRRLPKGTHLDSIEFDCIEAKWLMGFLCNKGLEAPRKTVTGLVSIDRPNFANFQLKNIASNLFKIKHWEIRQGCYSEIENTEATHFIDPPYKKGGHSYIHSNKKIDFTHLAEYCRTREGQVIVCEHSTADWLPFKQFAVHKGKSGMQSEGIWTNEKTYFDNIQTKLLLP